VRRFKTAIVVGASDNLSHETFDRTRELSKASFFDRCAVV
jgi:hypothetical protein